MHGFGSHRKVKLIVAVEVGHRYAEWVGPCIVIGRGLEGAIAIPHENRHRAGGIIVRDNEVRLAIVVEVAYRHGLRKHSRAVVGGFLESAISVAQ